MVKDGVMYITTGQQDIFALDAKTGAIDLGISPGRRSEDARQQSQARRGDGRRNGIRRSHRYPQAGAGVGPVGAGDFTCSLSIRRPESCSGSTSSAKTFRRTSANTSPRRRCITRAWCT